jgi:hypothetical protein
LKLLTRLKLSLSRMFELKQKESDHLPILYLSQPAGGRHRLPSRTVSDRRITLMLRVA